MPKLSVILILSLFFCNYISAQFVVEADSISPKKQFALDEKKFPVRSFIVPVALMTYGFIASRIDATTDLSEFFKEEIWTENVHPQVHADNYLQFAPAIAVYGLHVVGIKGRNNLIDASLIYLMSNIILNTTVTIVKSVSHEQRPNGDGFYSFPSGHTAEAFASADFLFQEYRHLSPLYGIAGYAIATSVAYLRMYNNKHWFHDVVAGAGFGIASTRLSYWIYPKIKRLFSKKEQMHTMIMPFYNNKVYGISLAHIFK